MKRIVFAAAAVALAGLVMMAATHQGLAQPLEPGPGEGGSILKDPYAPAAPIKPAPSAGYAETLLNPAPMGSPTVNPGFGSRHLVPPEEKPDINQDMQVTKQLGPWLIMVHSYSGPEASIMARQMVTELRAAYKLAAYTFNYGAEERRKEYERVKATIEKQKEYLAKNGLAPDHIRIRTMRIEEQVGVLIGGYPTQEAAKHALDGIRNLKPPDPDKVMLDKRVFYGEEKDRKQDTPQKAERLLEGYVNPFKSAFVAHNPIIKQERPADWDKLDMGLLQKLNASETFSLLTCKKAFTLAVKDFQTPTIVQPKSAAGSFLEVLGMGGKSGQRVDAAATSAHNLAELLRKAKLDAYVLHTKYTSIVTVGGYDSLEDPSMRTMANLIETRVMPQITQFLPPPPPNQGVNQTKVIPMQIPR